jgi:predicted RND superfamily exporter protein
MSTQAHEHSWHLGKYVLRFRAPIGLLLIGITAFMGYWAARVNVATSFENFFPTRHRNTLLYRQFKNQYGGAQSLCLLLRVKKDDVFNYKTLHTIQDISKDFNELPGVNHNEVFSIASERVSFARALPGALLSTFFMYPRVPETLAGLAELKRNVVDHREAVQGLITYDNKGALVTATFNEANIDYRVLFDDVHRIVEKYQDASTEIVVAGQPLISGWGYHYLKPIEIIFLLAITMMLAFLYVSLGERSSWWAPILTGSFSAVWGLGFVSLMGYNFDPVMLVIPFILTARDLSHGIQWQGRYYDELDRVDDKLLACATTTDVMLPPGMLSIFADIAGIVFISLGGIPVLKEIGLGGAVWLAASLTMVFVFQPVFMSYLPRPRIREWSRLGRHKLGSRSRILDPAIDWLVRVPITPGVFRSSLLAGGALFVVFGLVSGQRARIGYETPGTPLFRQDSKVNRDLKEISKVYPTDVGWIVLASPDFPDPQSSIGSDVLRMTDDLGDFLLKRGDAVAVVSFANSVAEPLNMMFHNGFPKYRSIPDSTELGGNLWSVFFSGTGPGEIERFFAHSPKMTSSCIRVMLLDHTYSRLNHLREGIETFVAERVTNNPRLNKVTVSYLGGEAGLYLAANDVLYRLDILNLTFVFFVIFVCCAFTFWSITAGILFIVACIMANFGAFIYMNARDIGLTIDTIPVISLGIGLGVDYGIYTVARIRDEVIGGATLEDSITTALRSTGASVFSTFAVMIGGILPWTFSPLLFHEEMSVLLIFLMFTNMVAGVLVLPAYIAWRRPRFICRYEGVDESNQSSRAPNATSSMGR